MCIWPKACLCIVTEEIIQGRIKVKPLWGELQSHWQRWDPGSGKGVCYVAVAVLAGKIWEKLWPSLPENACIPTEETLCMISVGSWLLSQAPSIIPNEERRVQSGYGVHDLGRYWASVSLFWRLLTPFRSASVELALLPLCTPQQDSADPHTLHPPLWACLSRWVG